MKLRRSNTGPALRRIAIVMAPMALSGCVLYHLGYTPPPGVKSVHITTFVNRAGEPGLETETTSAAITEFQKDGTLSVVPSDKADAVLNVTLTELKLEPLRYEKDRAKTAVEYRLRICADVVLERARTGEVVLKRRVEGWSTFVVVGDMASSKRTAIPAAARNLAHHIVVAVVEYW